MAVGVARRSPLPGSNCHAARAHPGKRKETADASIKPNDISVFSRAFLPRNLYCQNKKCPKKRPILLVLYI